MIKADRQVVFCHTITHFKNIIPYFAKQFKSFLRFLHPNHAAGVYLIRSLPAAYHQFQRNCISSTRSVAYHQPRRAAYHQPRRAVYHQPEGLHIIKAERFASHQAAGRYTLARDEIQGRNAPLMICTARCAAMICQACGLDKKIRALRLGFFGRGRRILNPAEQARHQAAP